MTWIDTLATWYPAVAPVVIAVADIAMALVATLHVILHKESTRAAAGWIGLIWLAPLLGVALYLVLGINRIHRKAALLRGDLSGYRHLPRPHSDAELPDDLGELRRLARFVHRAAHRPLVGGNAVDLLIDGDEAYPAMLRAIEEARHSVALSTYIFDHDPWGRRFVEALGDAVDRGLQVRVLVDAIGARYSFPSILRPLRRRGVPVRRFLHSIWPWRMGWMNLRNHRKLLVLDGHTAFAGGMNIRQGHVLGDEPSSPVRDLMVRVRGPVVPELLDVFATDWAFTTDETLEGPDWYPEVTPAGQVQARALPDGPDEDFEIAAWTFRGALACAQRSVVIVTPYFLPEEDLLAALDTAALRGVDVELFLPAANNLPYMNWAAWSELEGVLEHGCRVWWTAPPFDHTKLMVVDQAWTLVGSANWDARSLRLNFELNLECWDRDLARQALELVETRRRTATRATVEQVRRRGLARRLRDGTVRLLKPYL